MRELGGAGDMGQAFHNRPLYGALGSAPAFGSFLRCFQGHSESGLFSRIWDISRYIRIYPLESSRHPMLEQNRRHCWKAQLMLRFLVERLMNMRCCCEQEAAAYRTVLYPNHFSEAPGADAL